MWYLRRLIYLWLIVSAPLLGVTGTDQAAFLCWGAGGHVGIEAEPCDPHCELPSASSDHEESSVYTVCQDDDSCGACIDIPLPSGWATKCFVRRPGGSELRRATVCVTYCREPVVTGFKAAGEYCRLSRPAAGDESIASLRTIVLLI